MVIYIVWYTNFDSVDEFHSVHSTEENAQAQIARYSRRDQGSFRIERYTVAEE